MLISKQETDPTILSTTLSQNTLSSATLIIDSLQPATLSTEISVSVTSVKDTLSSTNLSTDTTSSANRSTEILSSDLYFSKHAISIVWDLFIRDIQREPTLSIRQIASLFIHLFNTATIRGTMAQKARAKLLWHMDIDAADAFMLLWEPGGDADLSKIQNSLRWQSSSQDYLLEGKDCSSLSDCAFWAKVFGPFSNSTFATPRKCLTNYEAIDMLYALNLTIEKSMGNPETNETLEHIQEQTQNIKTLCNQHSTHNCFTYHLLSLGSLIKGAIRITSGDKVYEGFLFQMPVRSGDGWCEVKFVIQKKNRSKVITNWRNIFTIVTLGN